MNTPQKMKSYLEAIVSLVNEALERGPGEVGRSCLLETIKKKAESALSTPLRNCDVGTAEEQAERFFVFCNHNKCPSCSCRFTPKTDCALIWAQVPYYEGGAK